MRSASRRFVAALGIAAGLLLAGCGNDGSSGSTQGGTTEGEQALTAAIFTNASDQTSAAGSSRFALTSSSTVSGQTLDINGEGVFDYANQRGTMTMNMTELGTVTTVIDGSVVYQQVPEAEAAALGGQWVRVDTAAVTGVDPNQQAVSNDPSAIMDWLRGASDEITEVGTEDVRGEQATHYKVVLDLQRAAEQSGQDPAVQQGLLQSLSSTTVPADVWIDAEQRLRKISYTLDMNAGGQTATTSLTMELWDFGTEVAVEIPPANEVVDLNEQLSQLQDQAPGQAPGAG